MTETMIQTDADGFQEGNIIAGHYGYDAHRSEFFRVIKRTEKTVTLVYLDEHIVEAHGQAGWKVMPGDQEFGKPFRRKLHVAHRDNGDALYVQITDYERAYAWNGKPIENSDWH